MYVEQMKTLLENGEYAVDEKGILKSDVDINETKEWWLALLEKADKVEHRGYTLLITYQNYQYSLRFLNERITDKADAKAWINKHWDKYKEMDENVNK